MEHRATKAATTTNRSTNERLLELVASVHAVDRASAEAATAHQLRLTKPPGSLGAIETIGAQMAAIAGSPMPPPPEPAVVVVVAGDHGVHAEGVSPWPQEVTGQMVQNFCAGGAAINVIARANGMAVVVVNAGVAAELDDQPGLRNTPIRRGTANLARTSAMTRSEAQEAILLGADVAREQIEAGARCLITGDMGIANTTPSAALIAAITKREPSSVTGRGTGIDDATLALKVGVVEAALDRIDVGPDDPVGLVSEIGGLEIATLAGVCLGAATARVPVMVDGVITLAGALVASCLAPDVVGHLIAGHRSVEPAASAALDHLGLEPLLDLDLRLGEGTGAALAYPLVRAAARIMSEMATFDQAGVDEGGQACV